MRRNARTEFVGCFILAVIVVSMVWLVIVLTRF
jgi:hypothetical protein